MSLNKQQLEAVNQANFPDNNSQLITPSKLREFNTDIIDAIQLTGSYATTGSNTFVGNQTIIGDLSVSGVISASVLYVQTETASVIYSSGSNQFGDELTDVQTLSGSVKVQGSLTVNGVPVLTSSADISGFVTTGSFNAYTQSTNLRLNSLETNSASVNVSISNLNTTTASLSTSITNINQFTQSQSALNGTFATTGSNTFTGNQIIDRASKLFTNGVYWTDPTAGFNNLEIINQGGGNLDFASLNGGRMRVVNTPLQLTGSALSSNSDISTSANIYAANLTGSATIPAGTISSSAQITSLGFVSSSVTASSIVDIFNTIVDNQFTYTKGDGSQQTVTLNSSGGGSVPAGTISGSQQITNLGFVSSSVTASSLITASFSGNTLTFTKGDASTFGVVIPDVSGSTINTGSFATTGSNTFNGNQTINGNVDITGSLRLNVIGNYGGNGLDINGGQGGVDFNLNGYNTSIKLGAYTPISITGDTEITGALNLTGSILATDNIRSNNYLVAINGVQTNLITVPGGAGDITIDTLLSPGEIFLNSNKVSVSNDLIITGSLTASLQEGYVWVGNATGRTVTVATSSFGGGVTIDTGSLMVTGSVNVNVLTFTKGDGTTFDLTVAASGSVTPGTISGSAQITALGFVSSSVTASSLITASAAGSTITFTKGDNTQFNVTLDTGSATSSPTIFEVVYTGENITKGDPLYISGSQGANPRVFKADAAVPAKMPVTFVANETIGVNNTTNAIILGLIEGIDLTGYVAGQAIYVAEGGGWSLNLPSGSNSITQLLGVVTKGGSGGKGLVLNPGPAQLPGLDTGKMWVGNGNNQPVEITTASFASSASFNSYTSSTNSRLTNIESTTASLNLSINQLNEFTESQEVYNNFIANKVGSLEIATASLFTSASLSLTTASVTGTTMTFSKGDGTTFNVTLPTGSGGGTIDTGSLMVTGSVAGNVLTFTKGDATTFSLTVDTGSGGGTIDTASFATTGSNTFRGDQTVSGSVNIINFANGEVDTLKLLPYLSSSTFNGNRDTILTARQAITRDGISYELAPTSPVNIILGATNPAVSASSLVSGSNNIITNGTNFNTNAANIEANSSYISVFPSTRIPAYAPVRFINSNVNAAITAINNTNGLSASFAAGFAGYSSFAGQAAVSVNASGIFSGMVINPNSSSVTLAQSVNAGNLTITGNKLNPNISASSFIISNTLNLGTTTLIDLASGSYSSGNTAFSRNLYGGVVTATNISASTSLANLQNTIIFGSNLIVTGSDGTVAGNGGSAFFGRFNVNDGFTNRTSNTVFAVGAGTGTGTNARTPLWVGTDTSVNVTGSLRVSGSLIVNGIDIVSGSGGSINTGSFATTGSNSFNGNQTISGSLRVSGSTTLQGTTTFIDRDGSSNNNIYLGDNSFGSAIGNTFSIAMGVQSMRFASGSTENIALGSNSLLRTTGSKNTAIGSNAMENNTTGNENLAIGINALNKNTTANFNTAIGNNALQFNTTGGNNFALGQVALNQNTTGTQNVAIGVGALNQNTTGNKNIAIGNDAGINASGSNNTYIGDEAGGNITGSNNVIIGRFSGTTGQVLDNNIILSDGQKNVRARYDAGAWSLNGNLIVTGSFVGANTFSGSVAFTGSVVGNVVALGITSNTASMDFNNGNYFTLTLADNATTHISASNVQPGVSATLVITTGTNSTASLAPTLLQPSGLQYSATVGTGKKDVLSIVAVEAGVPYVVSTKNMV